MRKRKRKRVKNEDGERKKMIQQPIYINHLFPYSNIYLFAGAKY